MLKGIMESLPAIPFTFCKLMKMNPVRIIFQSDKGIDGNKVVDMYTNYKAEPHQTSTTAVTVCTIVDAPQYEGEWVLLDGYHRREAWTRLWSESGMNANFLMRKWKRITLQQAAEAFYRLNKEHFQLQDPVVGHQTLEDAVARCRAMWPTNIDERSNANLTKIRADTLRDAVAFVMRGHRDPDYAYRRLKEFSDKLCRVPDAHFDHTFTGRNVTLGADKLAAGVAKAKRAHFMLGVFKNARALRAAIQPDATAPGKALGDVRLTDREWDDTWFHHFGGRAFGECRRCGKRLAKADAHYVLHALHGTGYSSANMDPCCGECEVSTRQARALTTAITRAGNGPAGTEVREVAPPTKRKLQQRQMDGYLKRAKPAPPNHTTQSTATATAPPNHTTATATLLPRMHSTVTTPPNTPDTSSVQPPQPMWAQLLETRLRGAFVPVTHWKQGTRMSDMNDWVKEHAADILPTKTGVSKVLHTVCPRVGFPIHQRKNMRVPSWSGKDTPVDSVYMCARITGL